ncbi:MAG: preprotein translocase subunit SecE [Bacteroidales bacterium]|nr:preprotein translocase subunit SecE [Bacteroidales bacterium]
MFTKIKTYLQSTYDELVNKVSWPTWTDVQNSAVIVMVATFIIAIVVFLMDISLKSIMEMIYGLFKSTK